MTEEGRQLEYGGEYLPPQVEDSQQVALRVRMANFIQTQEWRDICDISSAIVGSYRVELPRREHDKQAYELFNIVRDVFTAFQFEVAILATKGDQHKKGGTVE